MKVSGLDNKQEGSISAAFLVGSLGRAFIKQCISTKAFRLATPENDFEREQIFDVRKDINRARCDFTSLIYAIMFDKIIIDDTILLGNHLFESRSVEDSSARPLVEAILHELSTWFSIESGALERVDYLSDVGTGKLPPVLKGVHEASEKEQATFMSLIEPILWHRLKALRKKKLITREILRDILDLLILRPEIISIRDSIVAGEEEKIPTTYLKPLFFKYHMDEISIRYFRNMIYTVLVKSGVALTQLRIAIKHSAVMPIPSLTFGKNRNLSKYLNAIKKDNVTVGIRLLLDEVEYWPVVHNLNDVLRLREKPYMQEFRNFLRQWVHAIEIGDKKEESKLGSEIRAANLSLKRTTKCRKVGRIMVYIAIPFIVLDAIWLPVFGPSLGLAGFGLQVYADKLMGKHRWITVCTE